MLKNYLTVALRNIQKYKVLSAIKIFGLSIGIAFCILIYLYAADELSFDRFHENGEHLYRLLTVTHDKDTGMETGREPFLPAPFGPQLQRNSQEVKYHSRYVNGAGVVRVNEKIFGETVTLVDSPFFEMFSFPLVQGNPASALPNEHSVVLPLSLARKYFADENPLGKWLSLSFGKASQDFLVTAVVQDAPSNSSIPFGLLIHFDNLPAVSNEPGILQDWNRWYCPVFVQLKPGFSAARMDAVLDLFAKQYFGGEMRRRRDQGHDPFTLGLQKVEDIRLDTRVAGTPGLTPAYLLSAIALAILLIACVNFANLSIGLSSTRAKEVGLRKAVGAQKRQIITQFTCEALLISLIAVVIGMSLAGLLIPTFNALSGKRLPVFSPFRSAHLLAIGMIAVATGLIAGGYPAVAISAFRPVDIMKGRLRAGGKTALTKGLVILQFVLSVVLAISAITLGRQVSYLAKRDLGYVSNGLVAVMTQENDLPSSERVCRLFRDEIVSHSNVQGVTASHREFGLFLPSIKLETNGRDVVFRCNRVDPGFLSTMKIRLVQGRDFSPNVSADNDAVIVNRKFLEALGPRYRMGDALGDPSRGFPSSSRIVGVIENGHVRSLLSEMEPLLLYVGKGRSANRDVLSRFFVRIGKEDVKGTMEFLGRAWKRIQPEKPFVHYFQDEALARLYANEKRWSAIVRAASLFSLILACTGIFGLTALTLSRRKMEIGIRKVLGAGLEQIVYSAIKEFVVSIALANAVAWPVVFVMMRKVLQRYPYRVDIGFPYFVLVGVASIGVAVLTILYLSLKAALANPAECLKCE